METMIPMLPCVSLDETLEFYRVLGFEVTYEQTKPYVYVAVRRGGIELHFYGLKGLDPQQTHSTCLVMVPEAEPYHRAFADALRGKYGRVPITGIPRITRFKKGQSRFTVVDPSGNSVIYIRRDEPDLEYYGGKGQMSDLERAIKNAATFRDFKNDDKGAAKILDVALARHPEGAPIERARALAARAELAVAMGDAERTRAVLTELQQLPLSDEDRERIRHELQAADNLERWLTQKEGEVGESQSDPL